jgi:hypothetical protein
MRRLSQPRLRADELAILDRPMGCGAKMIGAFGAPIDQADAKIIADNLKKNYES